MFVLTKLKDVVRVEPHDLGRPTAEAVTACLERTIFNKVITDVGLVVTLYDLLSVTGGHIYPSDGAAHFEVTFRVLVFQPFVGEVLVGRLVGSDAQGLHVSLGFFGEVHVSHERMPEPSMFEPGEPGAWFWLYDGNRMYLELDEPIRVRVTEVVFAAVPAGQQLQAPEMDEASPGSMGNTFAPMKARALVGASITGEGLGMTAWWGQSPEDGEDAEE